MYQIICFQLKFVLFLFLGATQHQDIKSYYIKIDLIGVKYVKEFEDKSSQEFKDMACDIEEEVKKLSASWVSFYTKL